MISKGDAEASGISSHFPLKQSSGISLSELGIRLKHAAAPALQWLPMRMFCAVTTCNKEIVDRNMKRGKSNEEEFDEQQKSAITKVVSISGNIRFLRIIFFCLLFHGSLAKIITAPRHMAVVKGIKATFECSTDSMIGLEWRVGKTLSDSSRVYDGNRVLDEFRSLYNVTKGPNGHYDFTVLSASEDSEALYQCTDVYVTPPESKSAELVVLDDEPQLHREKGEMDYAYLIISSVNYTGKWSMRMECKRNVDCCNPEQADFESSSGKMFMATVEIFQRDRNQTANCTIQFKKDGSVPDSFKYYFKETVQIPNYPDPCGHEDLEHRILTIGIPLVLATSLHLALFIGIFILFKIGICKIGKNNSGINKDISLTT